ALEHELTSVQHELDETRARVERDRARAELAQRLGRLEAKVSDADCKLQAQNTKLTSWESLWEGLEPQFDSRLQALKVGIEERWPPLAQTTNTAAKPASEARARTERLDESFQKTRDRARMGDGLVGPVVQLWGAPPVGSGVLLESRPTADASK